MCPQLARGGLPSFLVLAADGPCWGEPGQSLEADSAPAFGVLLYSDPSFSPHGPPP